MRLVRVLVVVPLARVLDSTIMIFVEGNGTVESKEDRVKYFGRLNNQRVVCWQLVCKALGILVQGEGTGGVWGPHVVLYVQMSTLKRGSKDLNGLKVRKHKWL